MSTLVDDEGWQVWADVFGHSTSFPWIETTVGEDDVGVSSEINLLVIASEL